MVEGEEAVFPSRRCHCGRQEHVRRVWTIPRQSSDNDWWNIYIALGSRIITLRPDPHNTIRAMFTLMPQNPAQKKAWEGASRGDRKTQQELLRYEFAAAGWQA